MLRSRLLVVFHYYETIDISKCSRSDRIAFRIISRLSKAVDNILVPEKNRLAQVAADFPLLQPKLLQLPNTTCRTSPRQKTQRLAGAPLSLLHVGALGEGTFAMKLIDAVVAMEGRVHLSLVGFVAVSIRDYIRGHAKDYVTHHEQVPHRELSNFYCACDVGLILYRPTTLNTKFAAPNKLYEFWSFGIPVLGPTIPGLQSQFTQPEMGILVDMDSADCIASGLDALIRYSDVEARKLKTFFDDKLSAEILVTPIVDRLISDAEKR